MPLEFWFIVLLVVVGALFLMSRMVKLGTKQLLTSFVGIIIGLIVGALLSIPLATLPGPYGQWLPLIISILSAIMFGSLFSARGALFVSFLYQAITGRGSLVASGREIILDTSAIIDGRIGEIAQSGFLFGTLLIPRMVLEELQHIADSTDQLRRAKGRRGLEVLTALEKNADVTIEVVEGDTGKSKAVDARLVNLAQQRGAVIMTTDYNLNRVAEIQRVPVLNVNELANALRPPVLPGEDLAVKVLSKGKEKGQGVGYLDDGTMIVVEGGEKLVGKEVDAVVSRALQTVAGKMIFVTPKEADKRRR